MVHSDAFLNDGLEVWAAEKKNERKYAKWFILALF